MKTKESFYNKTKANFLGCKKPKRKPDYVSYDYDGNISSLYWYTDEGVYRYSNHWSRVSIKNTRTIQCDYVASCWWTLTTNKNGFWQCGFCAWHKFTNVR